MFITQPIRFRTITILTFIGFSHGLLQAQSILLINTNTKVYDNYTETKILKLELKEETWVNYKGRFGSFFKVSNFFGKDEYYPNGVFEGYVSITSVLDTASREEYKSLTNSTEQVISAPQSISASSADNIKATSNEATTNFDIDKYYIGMSKNQALSINKSSIKLGSNSYNIKLKFNQIDILSELELAGDLEDALAVDEDVKKQYSELYTILSDKYGNSSRSNSYPSFLEISESKVYEVTKWALPDKTISLGIGEKDDLYYSSVIIKKQ